MINITSIVETIGIDRITHFLMCYAISMTLGIHTVWWIGLAVSVVVGVLKEVWDYVSHQGTPDWNDFLADCIGAVVGVAMMMI